MESFLDSYPVDRLERIPRQDWVRYLALVTLCSAADGFSDAERLAIRETIKAMGLDEALMDEAEALHGRTLEELLPEEPVRSILAPYLIRDAYKVLRVDGVSNAEMDTLKAIAAHIGVQGSRLQAVCQSVEDYFQAQENWKAATSN